MKSLLRKGSWTTALGVALLLAAGCGAPGDREARAGRREFARGQYVRARAQLEKALARRPPGHPENAALYNLLGVAHGRLGDVENAARAFRESRRLSPEAFSPACNLGALLLQSGDTLGAAALFEEASLLDEKAAEPLEHLGALHAAQGRWDQALQSLLAARNRAPQEARILNALSQVYLKLEGPGAAVSWLMRALEKDTRYAPALYNLHVIYRDALKIPAQAAAFGRRYLEVAPGESRAPAVRAYLLSLAPAAAAPAPPTSPPAPAAAPVPPTAATKPAVVDPEFVGPPAPPAAAGNDPLSQARALAARGDARGALNRCLEAAEQARRARNGAAREAALRAAVDVAFDQPDAHLAWGNYLMDQGRAEAAVKAFKQSIALQPRFSAGHFALARAALKAGEFDTALVSLRQSVQTDAENADARWLLAEIFEQPLNRRADAAREYREFLRLFPGDPRVLKARERLGVLEPARAAPPAPAAAAAPAAAPTPPAEPERPPGGKTIELRPADPPNPRAARQALERGLAHQRDGDAERAVYYFVRALENDPKLAAAWFGLGVAHTARGDGALAADAYYRLLALEPEHAIARYNLALLRHEAGQSAAARAQLQRLLRTQPDYAPAHYLLGTQYAADRAARPEARRHFQRFLELAPRDPNAPAVTAWLRANP